MAPEPRMAVLLAATILAAPHTIGYDSVMLAFAATLLVYRNLETGPRAGEVAIALLVWLSPLVSPPSLFRPGLLIPLLILCFILSAMRPDRAQATLSHRAGGLRQAP